MKRLVHVLLLAAAAAVSAFAQQTPAKVLRAVYFPPVAPDAALGRETEALVLEIPEILATSIASLQPFTRADSEDVARSVIAVTASPARAGRLTVRIRLLEAGSTKSETAREFSAAALDLESFRAFLGEASSRFAPLLGPVDPVAAALQVTADQQVLEPAKEADAVTQTDKRLELTLWASGLLRLLDSTGVGNSGGFYFGLGIPPLIAEADWFFSRNLGIQFSFYFNDTNAFDFGQSSRYAASGVFLFPGLGIIYRTRGTVSAELAFTLSAGWIYLTANSGNVVNQQGSVVLAQGSSVWSSLSARIRISPALVWSVTPSVALKGSLGFDFIFPGVFPWYNSPLADIQFLSVGIAYRI
ncbi:MAG: hypothetical protein ACLQDL_15210 [Spirochaetia bacterium]